MIGLKGSTQIDKHGHVSIQEIGSPPSKQAGVFKNQLYESNFSVFFNFSSTSETYFSSFFNFSSAFQSNLLRSSSTFRQLSKVTFVVPSANFSTFFNFFAAFKSWIRNGPLNFSAFSNFPATFKSYFQYGGPAWQQLFWSIRSLCNKTVLISKCIGLD